MNRNTRYLIIVAAAFIGSALAFRLIPGVSALLWTVSDGGAWLLPLITVSALIDSINPCAFSILLLTVAFFVGVGASRTRLLAAGGAYIAGIFAVYLLIGYGLLRALHLFDTPHFMGRVGAALLILLGIVSALGALIPRFPIRLKIPEAAHRLMALFIDRATIPAAFALGAVVGLCEFPCTGGPYLMAVGLLHDRATAIVGAGYLLLYNAIFVLPLVIVLLLASDRHLLPRLQHWQRHERRAVRLAGALTMIALGVLILLL